MSSRTGDLEEREMAIAAAMGEALVALEDLDAFARHSRPDLELLLQETRGEGKSVTIGGKQVKSRDLKRAKDVKSTTNPYEGIGLGKPLTIIIESIYLGDYPDALRWFPGDNLGDVLVTSANKAFEVFAAAPRAVHMLQAKATRQSFLTAKATQQGSRLVYYSPAVTDVAIILTIELSVDRDFSDELGAQFAKAVSAAGALPVFAPAAPYLVAASTAIPITVNAANMLAHPRTFFESTVTLNFALNGVPLAQPDSLLLHPDDDGTLVNGDYHVGSEFQLVDGDDKPYAGPVPYIVISLDGAEREEFASWTAEAATSSLLERFFSPDERISKTLDIVSDGLSLYNDMQFHGKAVKAKEAAANSIGAAKKKHEKDLSAFLKNIHSKEIRNSI